MSEIPSNESTRRRAKDKPQSRRSPAPPLLGVIETVDLTAYRIQVEMVLERLARLDAVAAAEWTIDQQEGLAAAKQSLRSAATRMAQLVAPRLDW